MWPLWENKTETDEGEKQNIQTLECDYQRDCIPLYKNLENEKFDEVLKFLETGYWSGCFFADAVPPSDQVRTWITRFDESGKDKKVVWSQLTLHLAIVVGAPLSIVKKVVELYPQSIRCTDDQRMLPLHLAMRHGSDFEIVAFLLKQFPEAVDVRGGKGEGRLPVEYAQRGPNKALGDILLTFVERSRAKATRTAAKNHAKELEMLQAKLQAKEYELTNVKNRLGELDQEKDAMEKELAEKRKELKDSIESMEKLSALKMKEMESTVVENDKMLSKQMAAIERNLEKSKEEAISNTKQSKGSSKETILNKHITALEEHQTDLKKRIEEIEKKVEANKTESKARAEESGLLEELGSVIDQSIQELRERVSLEDDDDEKETEEEKKDLKQGNSQCDRQEELMKRIDEMEFDVDVHRAMSNKSLEDDDNDEKNNNLEKIGSELDASIKELRQRVKPQPPVETPQKADTPTVLEQVVIETVDSPRSHEATEIETVGDKQVDTTVQKNQGGRRRPKTPVHDLMKRVRDVTKRMKQTNIQNIKREVADVQESNDVKARKGVHSGQEESPVSASDENEKSFAHGDPPVYTSGDKEKSSTYNNSPGQTSVDNRDDAETDEELKDIENAKQSARAANEEEEEVASVLVAEVRVGGAEDARAINTNENEPEITVTDHAKPTGEEYVDNNADEQSVQSEIASLKHEVDRLRMQLNQNSVEQIQKQRKKSRMKDQLRSKFPFTKKKKNNATLTYTPTI